MSDLVERLRDLSTRNFLSSAELLSLQDHGRKAADEITRLQSALTEAQAEKEVMREALKSFIALEDGEAHIEDAFERLLPAAKAALQSTPPTDVARVIEAARIACHAHNVLAETEALSETGDAENWRDHLLEEDADLMEALADLDGGRKG